MREQDWEGALAAVDARLALEPKSKELRHLAAIFADPELRAPVAAALLNRRQADVGERLLALLEQHPDHPELQSLALSRLVLTEQITRRVLTRAERARLERFLVLLPSVPGACDARRRQLRKVGEQLARGGHLDEAERVATVLRTECSGDRSRHGGELLAARVTWARARASD